LLIGLRQVEAVKWERVFFSPHAREES
jgi:hypothetical protein